MQSSFHEQLFYIDQLDQTWKLMPGNPEYFPEELFSSNLGSANEMMYLKLLHGSYFIPDTPHPEFSTDPLNSVYAHQ